MGIVRVQTKAAGASAVTELELQLDPDPLAGAVMFMAIATSGGVDVTSVDQNGATWSLLKKQSGALTEAHLFGTNVTSAAEVDIIINLAAIANVAAVVCEYAGLLQTVDKTAMTSGVGSPARSGLTPQTTAARELWAAVLSARHGDVAFSNPRSGFQIVGQVSGGASQDEQHVALVDRIVDAIGTAEAVADISGTTLEWSGAIATILASAQTPQDPAGPPTPQPTVPEALIKQNNHVGDGLRNLVTQFRTLT